LSIVWLEFPFLDILSFLNCSELLNKSAVVGVLLDRFDSLYEAEMSNKFKLDGYDIITDLYLTPWEAALGKRVSVSSIEDTVSVYVPPGIQSGERIRIPKKGYKDGISSRGDLVAEVKTVVPKKLTDEEKELFEKLKNISNFKPRGN
jgi:curved DNA-binding protein